MLDSTLELITQAVSNSLFIFCFCNLIIVMILVVSKPGSGFDQEGEIPLSTAGNAYANGEKREALQVKHSFDGNKIAKNATEATNALEAFGEEREEENGNDGSSSNEDDDELRKRVEEFIRKVNKGWREELFRTSHLA